MIKHQQNWLQLLCIQAGGAICLPIIMLGQVLAQSYGLWAALGMIACGNAFLLVYALFTSKMAVCERKSTIELVVGLFGRYGSALFGAIFLVSMVGWFAIQINVVTESLSQYLFFSPIVLNLLLGALMTVVSCCGIRGLQVLSQLSAPLLIATLAIALYFTTGSLQVEAHPFSFGGISLVIAAAIGGAIDIPTYWRHAKSRSDGTIAAVLLFGVALPLIESVGVYLGFHASSTNLLATLTQQGGLGWELWVVGFLVLAGWTSNNTNLYSAGINSFSLLPKLSFVRRTLLIGAFGTMLSCMNLLQHFSMALDVMGILIASMGAVMIVSYFLKSNRVYIPCGIGVVIGLMSLAGFSLTGAPVVDAFLSAAIGTMLFRRRYEVSTN